MQIDNPIKQQGIAIIQPWEAIPDQKILQNLNNPEEEKSNQTKPKIIRL